MTMFSSMLIIICCYDFVCATGGSRARCFFSDIFYLSSVKSTEIGKTQFSKLLEIRFGRKFDKHRYVQWIEKHGMELTG